MSSSPAPRPVSMADDLRARIIDDPALILDDVDVMRALVAENEKKLGANIVDLRGIAMERLETRLDRLEETHRSVIAAAYENLAGTNQIHRAVLALLEPQDFPGFLGALSGEAAAILRVDCLRLVLETRRPEDEEALNALDEAVTVVPAGFADAYAAGAHGRGARAVTLRQMVPGSDALYGAKSATIRSEALLRLDLGEGRLPALLAMGSDDPQQFAPNQGTDLLTFFAGVFERVLRRHLG
ncbi:hypothetical protein SAMN05444722_3575 [Rhodovulum sp. ES.010]|uniref:DUF484 family protein n=1 Tax=Rhodovulum sp. ES.010 TaxID=1882821 RepID=UPI00092AC05F|nr:DUF484 family protein [Rhodovulum sp. ES.010]SIO56186.1 hypothetical protein SAMN05444722_3575 [Rhodovulum sp. ES.010]